MNDHRHAGRRGLALAWRRWHLGLLFSGLMLGASLTDLSDFGLDAGAAGRPPALLAEEGHGAPIWSVAFAGPGRLVSATTAGEVRLKDFAAGPGLRLLDASRSFTLVPAASPDGRILAIPGDRPDVRIWDAETGAEGAPCGAGAGMSRAVAFAADGSTLAVGTWMPEGQLATVALWSWPGRRRLATLEGHRGHILALAFAPDGSTLAAADSAGEVRIWDVADARERARIRAHAAAVTAMAISPDGRRLATASYLDGSVRLWDPRTGEPRGSLPDVATGVTALAFSPDGRLLAMARGDGVASLHHVASGLEAGAVRVASGSLQSVAFSPDGSLLATGGIDGSARLWDVARLRDGGRTPTSPPPSPARTMFTGIIRRNRGEATR